MYLCINFQISGVYDSLEVACWTINREIGLRVSARAEVYAAVSASPLPLANSAITSTIIQYCRWRDETAMKKTGHPPSHAESKKCEVAPHGLLKGLHACFSSIYCQFYMAFITKNLIVLSSVACTYLLLMAV